MKYVDHYLLGIKYVVRQIGKVFSYIKYIWEKNITDTLRGLAPITMASGWTMQQLLG